MLCVFHGEQVTFQDAVFNARCQRKNLKADGCTSVASNRQPVRQPLPAGRTVDRMNFPGQQPVAVGRFLLQSRQR